MKTSSRALVVAAVAFSTTLAAGIWSCGGDDQQWAAADGSVEEFAPMQDSAAPDWGLWDGGHPQWDSGSDDVRSPYDFLPLSCSDASVAPDAAPPCNDAGWCTEFPSPSGGVLLGVHGTSSSDVWGVGFLGAIVHGTVQGWATVASGTTRDLTAVWARATDDAWAVGDAGTILRWNGTAWAPQASGTTAVLYGVWSRAADDAWAVGDGIVLHFDGTQWSSTSPGARVHGIWGASADDVWAVGKYGFLQHWDGKQWSATQTTADLYAVWGSGASDVWAVGYDQSLGGVVLHFDGTQWSVPGTGLPFLSSVSGSGPNDVWAGGAGDSVSHWDGKSWSYFIPGNVAQYNVGFGNFTGVWVDAPNDVWIAPFLFPSSLPLHWDGLSLQSTLCGQLPSSLLGVWAGEDAGAWSVGVSVAEPGPAAIVRGSQGWALSPVPQADGGFTWFTSVWGSGANDVWAVGFESDASSPYALVGHWNGAAWSLSHGFGGVPGALYGVAGSAQDDVWTVGVESIDGGAGTLAARWDGSSWSVAPGVTPGGLTSVWANGPSDVWAIAGTDVAHFDGAKWSVTTPDPVVHLSSFTSPFGNAIWGSATNDVWAVGSGKNGTGAAVHWNGTKWTSAYGITPGALSGVWGTGPNDVWAVGAGDLSVELLGGVQFYRGAVAHWDGTAWSASTSASSLALTAVAGNHAGDAWAVGRTVLHRGP